MASEMTVDQLLTEQQEVRPLATLEAVEGKPDVVKITPWQRATRCMCGFALVVPKVRLFLSNPPAISTTAAEGDSKWWR